MTDNDLGRELARVINDAEVRLEGVVTREVARLDGRLQGHMDDRYAHGPAREAGHEQMKEWERWRASVDRWRWMLAGGVALFGLESTAVGIAVSLYGLFGRHP